jgi:hypothetical protein
VQNKSNAISAAFWGDTMARVLNLVLKYFKYNLSENPCFAIFPILVQR